MPSPGVSNEALSDTTKHDSASIHTPFTHDFFDKSPHIARARAVYFKAVIGGTVAVIVAIFAIFSIYWGALWKTPAHIHNLHGWVVDFDGSLIGQTVTQTLSGISGQPGIITWVIRDSAEFPGGPSDVATAVFDEKCWVAIAINPNATQKLLQATEDADASYDGTLAITAYGVEARSENAYRSFLKPNIDTALTHVGLLLARQHATQSANRTNIATILEAAPQVLLQPVSYSLMNIRPFDVPVAAAVTFVGLLYLTILAFFTTMIASGGREASGLEKVLSFPALLLVRVVTPLSAYFILSLFYSLLSYAFALPFGRFFGHSGFVIYWMLSWLGMSALGLALEVMLTVLTVKFIPFFLLVWIISNVSVALFPLELLPRIFQYGHASPFVRLSQGVRTIVFGTKNHLGLDFGILLAWVAISCVTLPLSVLWRHRQASKAHRLSLGQTTKEQSEETI